MSKKIKNWKKYFQDKAVSDIQLFEDRTKRSIQLQYTKNLKKLKANFTDTVRLEKLAYKVTTGQIEYNEDLTESIEFEKQAINQRLKNMSIKYKDIKEFLDWYNTDEISLDELNLLIEDFKEVNLIYLGTYNHK